MSRYEWPRSPKGQRGRAAQRRAYGLNRLAGAAPDGARGALLQRRAAAIDTALAAAPLFGAAPTGAADLWLPLGPAGTLRGSGDSDPRVSGRIRDLAVSGDGLRIYAATALGGLWYSPDAGRSWTPVGAFAGTSDRNELAPSSMTLSCGAVHVAFGADAASDEVWVGTGEPDPSQSPIDAGYQGNYSGVGILRALGPVQSVAAAPTSDPWHHEGQPEASYPGLRGRAVFSLAEDPSTPRRLVAATTSGLHTFDPAVVGSEPWSVAAVAAWEAALGAGNSNQVMVTDAVWVSTPAGTRLWVTVAGTKQDPRVKGLWRSDNGVTGPFVRVNLPGATSTAALRGLLNLGLAAAPSDGTVVYALANGPRLWRVDGDAGTRQVLGLPGALFGPAGTAGQSEYDLAIAVDPAQPDRVIVGGASVDSPIDVGMVAAALYLLTLRRPAPTGSASWRTDYAGGNASDARWVGAGVHPDVHRIRWSPAQAPAGQGSVVVGCDGGVFVSASDGGQATFVPRASGLAVTEAGFLDCHPTSDGIVLIGVQDNGNQLRIGESVWRRALLNGDGGGVAFDPGAPHRFIGEATRTDWTEDGGGGAGPTWRGFDDAARRTEDGASQFYSNAAVVRSSAGVTQLAVGTTRVWYSERWGHTFVDVPNNVIRADWVSLPSGIDPKAGNAQDTATDVLAPGPIPPGTFAPGATGIRALRWAGENRIYAVLPGAVYRIDRASGKWTRTRIMVRVTAAGAAAAPATGPVMPPHGSLNDLAVQDSTTGPHGAFYLATSHPLEPVWFFDGTATWHPTGLGTLPPPPPVPPGSPDGVLAPAYSVVVDRDDPSVVYAGTTVGVWKGTLTPTAGGPTWSWASYNNGLPEAAVQDLQIAAYPLPGGGQVRLLRAAVQARGVWEVDLDQAVAATTYLRVHPYDTRRALPVPLPDPLHPPTGADREWHLDWSDTRARDSRDGAGRPVAGPDGTAPGQFSWHASPDLRVRPVVGAPVPAVPGTLPWTGRPADRSQLWALQTALHAIDPLVVPDGRWTAMFRRRLRAIRALKTLARPNDAVVDLALWSHADVQAGFWADPWADGGPTEADLAERLVAQPTARPGGPTAATVSAASCALPAGKASVEVCVHRRAMLDAAADEVSVLVLRFALPANPSDWATLAVAPIAGLEAAMDAVPAAGGPLPGGVALPVGWTAADPGTAIHRPRDAVGTARPQVLSVPVDFTGNAGQTWMLLALVHAAPGEPDFASATTLRDLVLNSPNVAARSVDIV